MNTTKFLIQWILQALLWEGWSCINLEPEDTISETTWQWSKHFCIRFVVAYIFGHLFLQRNEDAQDHTFWIVLKRYPVIATLAGLFCGYAFWQRAPGLSKPK